LKGVPDPPEVQPSSSECFAVFVERVDFEVRAAVLFLLFLFVVAIADGRWNKEDLTKVCW